METNSGFSGVFEVLTQCFSIIVLLVLVYSVKDQEAIFRNILANIFFFGSLTVIGFYLTRLLILLTRQVLACV